MFRIGEDALAGQVAHRKGGFRRCGRAFKQSAFHAACCPVLLLCFGDLKASPSESIPQREAMCDVGNAHGLFLTGPRSTGARVIAAVRRASACADRHDPTEAWTSPGAWPVGLLQRPIRISRRCMVNKTLQMD